MAKLGITYAATASTRNTYGAYVDEAVAACPLLPWSRIVGDPAEDPPTYGAHFSPLYRRLSDGKEFGVPGGGDERHLTEEAIEWVAAFVAQAHPQSQIEIVIVTDAGFEFVPPDLQE